MADNEPSWEDLARQAGTPFPKAEAPTNNGEPSWDDLARQANTNQMLRSNPTLTEDIQSMFRFAGHGFIAGLADDLGMPVETLNMASEFARSHPILASAAGSLPGYGQIQAVAGFLPANIETGSAEFFKKKIGSLAEKPKEGSWAAEHGYDIAEFVGAAAPFGAAGGARKLASAVAARSVKPALSLLNDLIVQPGLVGFTATTGKDIGKAAGYPQTGEDIGLAVGIARAKGFMTALSKSKQAYSWLHDALGFGTGAEGKVRRKIGGLLGDDPAEVLRRGDTAPSDVYLPNDIKLKHDGLIALRREVAKNDAELAGAYDKAELALESAIRKEGEYSQTKFDRVENYLAEVQQEREMLTNLRMLQALDKADQTTNAVFSEALSKGVESEAYQSARALAVRSELGAARDDSWAVTQSEWDAVDKNKTVDPHSLYDTLAILEVENASRLRPDRSRFPSDIVDRFFKQGETEREPLYGVGTRLGHMIDASSDIEYAIRVESDTTKGVPDPVRLGYLRRIAEAINNVKFGAEGAETDPNLKRAIEATRFHHETFTNGPVGKVLGHREGGDPVILDSNTIRHFLAKGPAGIDAYNTLQRALAQRTGGAGKTTEIGGATVQKSAQKPSMKVRELLESYLKQDFFENNFPNGVYNPVRARQWMANHAGPMLAHPELRKELEGVIESQGRKTLDKKTYKKSVTELERSAAQLFLDNEPGKRFNAVMAASNQYDMMHELIEMTLRDPTGRATRGLAQMALDRMFMDATVFDGTSARMERLSGKKIRAWIKDNSGMLRAMEAARRPSGRRALPGITARFNAIAEKAEYLELFQIAPDSPKALDPKSLTMPLTHLLAAITGADLGAKLGRHAASLQTAHIGSAFLRNLIEKLTPDKARELLRQAFLDETFFKFLTTPITSQNIAKQKKILYPYLYALGAPVIAEEDERQRSGLPENARQSPKDGEWYIPDPKRPGMYLRVEHR